MTLSSNPDLDQANVEELRRVLDNLVNPSHLSDSPWVSATLIKNKLHEQPSLSAEQVLVNVIGETISDLEQSASTEKESQYARLLRRRYVQGAAPAQIYQDENYPTSESTYYRRQSEAIRHLGLYIWQQERQARQQAAANHHTRFLLTPTYNKLFGADSYVEQINAHLRTSNQQPVICIQGIGGIGKTALADCSVRHLLADNSTLFKGICWITAKQEYLTTVGIQGQRTKIRADQIIDELALQLEADTIPRLPLRQKIVELAKILRCEPYLVVVDNLETIDDFEQLIPLLQQVATPSKFILTCRKTVPMLEIVKPILLNQLDENSSIQLIRHTAQQKQISLSSFDPQQVFNLVGGNPLALILLICQMQLLPPKAVLSDIHSANMTDLYRYIFKRAWETLQENAQEVLFAIRDAGDKAEWSYLETILDMSANELQNAIRELNTLSLIQSHSVEQNDIEYHIHRLTSNFLRTDILRW